MKHRRTDRFRRTFQRLPPEIQQKAIKAFKLFRDNPSHPSLHIEKLEGEQGIWSGRVDDQYRFTFHYERDPETGETICVHRVIGTHEVYRNP